MGLAPTRASRPVPVFGTGSSSGRIASKTLGPSVGVAPTASSLPQTRSGSLSYKGTASPARIERATPAFGGRCSGPAELRRVGVDGRGRTCILRFRRPAP